MVSSSKIKDLLPCVEKKCRLFIAECHQQDINIIIISTYRESESGPSFHNYRRAFDFVPVVNNEARWDDLAAFKKCAIIAGSMGLEYHELGHCHYSGQLRLKDLGVNKRNIRLNLCRGHIDIPDQCLGCLLELD